MAAALAACLAAAPARGADQPQWGQRHTRNMVSAETHLPTTFDPETKQNVKWTADLGSETHATPVVASGKVLIGTNNGRPRNPLHKGDRGVLMCFGEEDGAFQWQLVVPKLGPDPYLDWPRGGIVSPPTVEGNKAYVVSNRGEVMCLDLHGQANGNDGPYRDEGKHMAVDGRATAVSKNDADILWLCDVRTVADVRQHDAAHCSILMDGRFLYVNTSNGVDNTHRRIRRPNAPSLVVVDKQTHRMVGQDAERIGPRIFHSTWSSPALGEVGGRRLIFFGGGDGVVYAFAALREVPAAGKLARLERVWRFDCDPAAPKEQVHRFIGNRRRSPSNIKSMPVFYKGRVYVTVGGDIWWGKNQAWLKCIDASKAGDVTDKAELWSYPLERHCCTTPSIHNGLVFVADCGKCIHCVDAETGKAYWTHRAHSALWASTLVADGKVYAATRRGRVLVFAAARDKKLLHEVRLDGAISATPTAANGTLYVATYKKLYAFAEQGK